MDRKSRPSAWIEAQIIISKSAAPHKGRPARDSAGRLAKHLTLAVAFAR